MQMSILFAIFTAKIIKKVKPTTPKLTSIVTKPLWKSEYFNPPRYFSPYRTIFLGATPKIG